MSFTTEHEDHLYPENEFPFSTAMLTDPYSGKSAALFRNDGFDPLLIETNTSTEYWQKGASLLTTDPLGQREVALPPNARAYLVASTQHAGRPGLKADFGPCMNERSPHNPMPAVRALLVALDQWATNGTPPPPSRVPSLAAGTLVKPDNQNFPAIPGFAVPRAGNTLPLFGDWVHPKPDQKLLQSLRENVTVDWAQREPARARMRVLVKRIFRKYGYPPDLQDKAVQTVQQQAKALSSVWTKLFGRR